MQRAKAQIEIQVEEEEVDESQTEVVQASTARSRPRLRRTRMPTRAVQWPNQWQSNGTSSIEWFGKNHPSGNNQTAPIQRAQATQAVNRPAALPNGGGNGNARLRGVGQAQAMEPIPQNAVMDSGHCESCQSGGMMSGHMQSGDMMMGGGCATCGSCDEMGCGCNSRMGSPGCIDFGSGPLASVLSWTLNRSYLRFQASNFQTYGADLPILASTATPPTAATTVLGNNRVNGDSIIGYRFQAGIWLDACNDKAIEVHGYDVGLKAHGFVQTLHRLARMIFSVL